jgi:hypothetical protein
MHQLLNTLYVTTEGAYLRADHDTLRVEVEKETKRNYKYRFTTSAGSFVLAMSC